MPSSLRTTSSPTLSKSSPLFYAAALVPALIILIGLRFILAPSAGAEGFGIPVSGSEVVPYLWVKGIRDIFSGVAVLTFLLQGDRRVAGILHTIAIWIPVADGFVTLANQGIAAPLLIHWPTAAYMAVVSYFLLQPEVKSTKREL